MKIRAEEELKMLDNIQQMDTSNPGSAKPSLNLKPFTKVIALISLAALVLINGKYTIHRETFTAPEGFLSTKNITTGYLQFQTEPCKQLTSISLLTITVVAYTSRTYDWIAINAFLIDQIYVLVANTIGVAMEFFLRDPALDNNLSLAFLLVLKELATLLVLSQVLFLVILKYYNAQPMSTALTNYKRIVTDFKTSTKTTRDIIEESLRAKKDL